MGIFKKLLRLLSGESNKEEIDQIDGFYVVKDVHGAEQARKLFKRANAGDVNATVEIANCFYESSETELSFRWLKKAADLGDAESMVMVSDYYDGRLIGGEVAPKMADYYLDQAVKLKCPKAFLKLADVHYSEDDPKENQIAFRYYLKAAQLGDPEGEAQVGIAYLNGIGVERNLEKAFHWLSKSTDYRHAAFPLAQCYLDGIGTYIDYEKATEYFERALEAGCIENNTARRNLIDLYDKGYGGALRISKRDRVKADLEASRKLLHELANSVLNS